MIELFLVAQLQSQCPKANTITPRQHYEVQSYIVNTLAAKGQVTKEGIDSRIGFSGCLQSKGQGQSPDLYIYRWEATDDKVIEARFQRSQFLKWKGENF